MKVTKSRFKNRQLHIEDYLQMVSAEQKEGHMMPSDNVRHIIPVMFLST